MSQSQVDEKTGKVVGSMGGTYLLWYREYFYLFIYCTWASTTSKI